MGAFVGLACGLGLLLIRQALTGRPRPRPATSSVGRRTAEVLAQAGYQAITPAQLYTVCLVTGAIVVVVAAAFSRSWPIAVAFGAFAAYAPVALVRHRRRQRQVELRDLWPDVVDNLSSAVRAGLALPEAVSQLSLRGPAALRPAFTAFAEDYRATGRFGDCLDRLKATLAGPVGDRIVETLRLAREVGGNDLGRVLRTLSQFLREDARTRAEIETRQGWTVNAARLALAAPWVVLGLFALRPDAVAAYNSVTGVIVLAAGGAVSLAAYRFMIRIGRLPQEQRVLR